MVVGAAGADLLGAAFSRFAPSLVDTCITQQNDYIEAETDVIDGIGTAQQCADKDRCKDGYWVKGVCSHGNERWLYIPCKRRRCPVCGAERRKKIAWRIAHGIEFIGGDDGAGWFVGSFDRDIDKRSAVKVVGKFVRWIRKVSGVHIDKRIEYACTWEVTRKGRLHCNLIMAPWSYMPQRKLSEKWSRYGGGKVVWIERVGAGIGVEAAKSREKVSNYFSKLEQMVDEGKSACYSKGFPKLPDTVKAKRVGDIVWLTGWSKGVDRSLFKLHGSGDTIEDLFFRDFVNFEYERDLGYWTEVRPGEYKSHDEDCDCFELVDYSDSS
jgi:hypothetical protein